MTDTGAPPQDHPDNMGKIVSDATDRAAPGSLPEGIGQRADRRGREPGGEVEHLLQRVRDQDAQAFRALYDLTSPHLMGVVMRTCRDKGMAEDVLQEVYVQIWRRSHLYEPGLGPAIAWLTVLARRRAIDAIRSSGRRARLLSDVELDVLDTLPHLAKDPTQSADLRHLLQCLDKLAPNHRRAVLLAYYEGWSREELALHFQRPEGTIKTWLRRSLIALRTCIETR